MPLKIENSLEQVRTALNDAQERFNLVSNSEDSTPEEINAALQGVIEANVAVQTAEFSNELENRMNEFNNSFEASKVKMSAKEHKFFNSINTEVGYKEEKLLPEETIDEIFEDLRTEHPVLGAIGVKNAGLRLKFLKSETSGMAVWGVIFGDIKGQLDAAFSEETEIQNKLTAFVVLPKDLSQFGPEWIKSFVVAQITEALDSALEEGFINGDGNNKPVGLIRKVAEGTSVTDGKYPKKTSTGTFTFADPETTVKEITAIFKYHSTKENARPFNASGKVTLLVNPADEWDVKTQYTHLNANGVYVTALPYNLTILSTPFVEVGEAISFVAERYDAWLGGGMTIKQYDQTLALEDMDLYTAKLFAFGKAKDDKTAALWTLNIAGADGHDVTIALSPKNGTANPGTTKQITATVAGANSSEIVWSISGDPGATIDQSGLVTIGAAVESETELTVTATIGQVSATATITVN